MSWKNEVIADSSGQWVTNALRFATEREARDYGANLYSRWTAVREYRATECDDPVNYTADESGNATPLPEAP